MQDAKVCKLEQAALAGVDEKALFDDPVQMECSRGDSKKFLEAFDITNDLAIVIGYNNSKDVRTKITKEIVRNLGDQRKGGEMRIHRHSTTESTGHPAFIALLHDGAVDQVETVLYRDPQPCVTQLKAIRYRHSFENA